MSKKTFMKTPKKLHAFTLIELLVVIAIIAILAGISVPAIIGGIDRARLADVLSNARNLTQATTIMALDANLGAGGGPGWPGSDASWDDYCNSLVEGKYLTQADLRKAVSASGVQPSPSVFPPDASAVQVYGVGDESDSDAIFISSWNWQGLQPLQATAKPFGDKGFVVYRKGGGGSVYQARDATSEALGKLVGSGFAPGPKASGQSGQQ